MRNTLKILDVGHSRFTADGFAVIPDFVESEQVAKMRESALGALEPLQGPVEFEADVGYPGAPTNRKQAGGMTPRRLLHAYVRDPIFGVWATTDSMKQALKIATDSENLMLSQNHHNCIMTKHPGYSSATHWHQDIRYWSFDRPELISVWLALGHENSENGGLAVIPGSHKLDLDRGHFDRHLFLREDLRVNQQLIEHAQQVELGPGDLLLFHCRLFHAAKKNDSADVKLSVVFTYHDRDNLPIPGTRSARNPSIPL